MKAFVNLFDRQKKEKLTKEEEKNVNLAATDLLEKLFDIKKKSLFKNDIRKNLLRK